MLTIRSGAFCANIDLSGKSAFLRSLLDGGACLFEGELPLFCLSAKDLSSGEEITATSADRWDGLAFHQNGDAASVCFSGCEKLTGISVILAASCGPGDSIEWKTSVSNSDGRLSVLSVSYPRAAFDVTGGASLFYPDGSGIVVPLKANTRYDRRSIYPSCGACMQYTAAYEGGRGLYYGIHDGRAAYKTICCTKDPDQPVRLYSEYAAEGIGRAGNSFTLSGSAVWCPLRGDWFDAAMIYKSFVEKEAGWLPKKGENGTPGMPAWMRNVPHWWLVSVGEDDSYVDKTLEVQKELGVPSAIHLYQWHVIPFDNDYPHYFPAKKQFLDSFRRLQQNGLPVMPYINGRLWDTRDKDCEDWQFTSVAYPGVTKNTEGKPYTESYSSVESDGSRVVLGVMCPSSPVWQKKVEDNVHRLTAEIGVDAVYIDQIAAAAPQLCADGDHDHVPGGGSWWTDAYNTLCSRIRSCLPENAEITTECNAEPFMKQIRGLLSWMWVVDGQVPAFPAVYAGYTPFFGRNYNALNDDTSVRIAIAQSVVYGEQTGWISPEKYRNLECRDFYNECVRTRYQYNEFFISGEMLRPPKVCGAETVCGNTSWGAGKISDKNVISGIWRNQNGKKLLLAANIADDPIRIRLESECFENGFIEPRLEPLSIKALIL